MLQEAAQGPRHLPGNQGVGLALIATQREHVYPAL